ncbi:MAG: hypothetical protein ND866_06735 [Pyrinomonadaceae bacterium]|nr:hypothetical protein [Pyrinomonadaceae bacterium]
MRTLEESANPQLVAAYARSNGNTKDVVLRLRLLISDLIDEVETLDQDPLSPSEVQLLENGDNISFYNEVRRFEIALIKSALQHALGHQCHAARLLNLNPSTLNAKIKQCNIRSFRH